MPAMFYSLSRAEQSLHGRLKNTGEPESQPDIGRTAPLDVGDSLTGDAHPLGEHSLGQASGLSAFSHPIARHERSSIPTLELCQ